MKENSNHHRDRSLIELFQQRWLDVDGEYIPVTTEAELSVKLKKFIRDNSISTAVLGASLSPSIADILIDEVEILADFRSNTHPLRQVLTPDATSKEKAKDTCSRAELGITGIDAFIAETGSMVSISRHTGDRMISSLPPIHLVIALDTPFYRDLDSFFEKAPSDLSFSLITGPSRTADIEKRLVLGAHGPKRVVILSCY
ncbi:MAG: LUD domain-containing protein [Candidatus Hatepunaea meridiana]|nr:LUD domain-containing protein [Candidatus Hatepunaea meridiana]